MGDDADVPGGIVCGGCGGRGSVPAAVAAAGPIRLNSYTTFGVDLGGSVRMRPGCHPSDYPIVKPNGWTSKGQVDAPGVPCGAIATAYVARRCKHCRGTGWL